MPPFLLDTDIPSEILKQRDPKVIQRATAYFQAHGQFAFSAFTRYEVVRGLKAKNASTQLARFETFCQNSLVLPITDAVLDRAAELWIVGRSGKHPHKDADFLIAATALDSSRTLATANTVDFDWIQGLAIENWRT